MPEQQSPSNDPRRCGHALSEDRVAAPSCDRWNSSLHLCACACRRWRWTSSPPRRLALSGRCKLSNRQALRVDRPKGMSRPLEAAPSGSRYDRFSWRCDTTPRATGYSKARARSERRPRHRRHTRSRKAQSRDDTPGSVEGDSASRRTPRTPSGAQPCSVIWAEELKP